MNYNLLIHQTRKLWQQRNIFVLSTGFLLVSNILLSIFVMSRSERVILVPPAITRPLWSENSHLSKEYLEEMSLFMAHLILDNSPDRAEYQRHLLMKYVSPDSYGKIKAQLLSQAETFKKNSVSTCFRPLDVKVWPKTHRVQINGKLSSFVGEKKISERDETVVIQFEMNHGRIFIKSFTPYMKEAQDDD